MVKMKVEKNMLALLLFAERSNRVEELVFSGNPLLLFSEISPGRE